ncbi:MULTISPECIES: (2Fe-2S)-binding protein [Streptomyces]|uniref:(2Fe-2S)-binding protein n=1 Tax=Streptomyces TaxID=1883 RepID=UPI00369A655D
MLLSTAIRPADRTVMDAAAPHTVAAVLAESYDRVAEALPWIAFLALGPDEALPEGGAWAGAAALARDPEALDRYLAWDREQVLRDHGRPGRPDVVAGFGLHRYAWPACLLFTLPWFLHRRVPYLPVERVAHDREHGRIAARPAGFACLPGDPAASVPGARVVRDEEALRAELRAAVAEHLEPVLGAFGPVMRRRGRGLWGMATDEITEGLWYVGTLLDEERRAMRELEALLPGTAKPYAGTPAFRELTGPRGESLTTRDRVSCCLFYTLNPSDTCVTCPRTCDEDRVAKLTTPAAG